MLSQCLVKSQLNLPTAECSTQLALRTGPHLTTCSDLREHSETSEQKFEEILKEKVHLPGIKWLSSPKPSGEIISQYEEKKKI